MLFDPDPRPFYHHARSTVPAETPPPSSSQAEIPCPYCGRPMLVAWGSSCGQCRPAVVAPKTLLRTMSAQELASLLPSGLNLGWLVVIRSPDAARAGQLLELDPGTTCLSRDANSRSEGDAAFVGFKDEFMSVRHATVRRPPIGMANARFTLSDRQSPGPSANGTLLNDRKLEPGERSELSDGDRILIGTTELLFRSLWLPPAGA